MTAMTVSRRVRWTWCAVLLLLVAACTGEADRTAPGPPDPVDPTAGTDVTTAAVIGGSVRYGLREEPDTLNPWASDAIDTVLPVSHALLAPLSRSLPDGTIEPWLLVADPQPSADGAARFEVVYDLRDDARWSDGQPIDGRDLLFTLEQCRRRPSAELPVLPCDAVDVRRSTADGTRATVVFERPVAGWRQPLGGLPVLPEHRLRDVDPAVALQERLPVSSGPFEFGSWVPGERMVLTRNDRWWRPPATLERLEFVFGDGLGVADVQRGDIDVVTVDATLDRMERARADDGVRVGIEPGDHWAALDFNVTSPLLERAAVRRALASALDREVIVDELLDPIAPAIGPRDGLLVDDDLVAEPLPTPGPSAATDLGQAGCAPGADEVYTCDGQRLALRLVSPADDWHLRLIGEYVVEQLSQAGAEIEHVSVAAGEELADEAWDIAVTAVAGGDPAQVGQRWRCGAPLNQPGFCNPTFDDLLDRATATRDAAERDAVYLEADLLLARERPTVPLYALPTMLVYHTTVRGPTLGVGPAGVIRNVDQWARTVRATSAR